MAKAEFEVSTVTLDTNVFPAEKLVQRSEKLGLEVAVISVTNREARKSSLIEEISALKEILEPMVWGESNWGRAYWGDRNTGELLEHILHILSNGSFPPLGARDSLSKGQKHSLRDAMILFTHVREGRDVLVTNDVKGFISHGRREMIESEFNTRIVSSKEFEDFLISLENKDVTENNS